MKYFLLLVLFTINLSLSGQPFPAPCAAADSRVTNNKPRKSCGDACAMAARCANNHGCNAKECVPFANCCPQKCSYTRRLPGDYDSFKESKHTFWHVPPCMPRNDSKYRGYLYKGMWWDNAGVRFWAIRNSTNNTITVEGLNNGETKDIPSGDVVNIGRGESYGFRVQAPARRFELFNSDMHNIEIFINLTGDIDYRVEPTLVKTSQNAARNEPFNTHPRF